LNPGAGHFELVVHHEEPTGPVALIVAEHRDHDLAIAEAMDGVWGGQLGFGDYLGRRDHLV
jgi:hypothetical protein